MSNNRPGYATNYSFLAIALFMIAATVGIIASPYAQFAFLPAFMLLFILALLYKPVSGFYLIVFLIPYSAYRGFLEGYRFLTVSKLVGVLLVGIIFITYFLREKSLARLKSRSWITLFVLAAVSIISALLSPYLSTSVDLLRNLITVYLFFGLTLVLIDRECFVNSLPMVIIVSAAISAGLSLAGYFLHVPGFTMDITDDNMRRGIGAAGNPNHFASMVIFSLPLAAHKIFQAKTVIRRLIFLGVFAINFFAVIFTFSRSGALVLFAVLVLMSLGRLKKIKPRQVGLLNGRRGHCRGDLSGHGSRLVLGKAEIHHRYRGLLHQPPVFLSPGGLGILLG